MTWQPGMPVITASDHTDWAAWRKARKLEQQRQRRQRYPRIDYYPSDAARSVIEAVARTRQGEAGTWSAVIDAMVLGASGISGPIRARARGLGNHKITSRLGELQSQRATPP